MEMVSFPKDSHIINTALYHLTETCNYGEIKSGMIQDRLVVGI